MKHVLLFLECYHECAAVMVSEVVAVPSRCIGISK